MVKSNYTWLFLISAICLICIGGCSKSARSEKKSRLSPDYSRTEFDKASGLKPNAKTLYVIANILASQGKERGSEATMKKIIVEYPDFFPVYNTLAELQLRQGRKAEAIATMHAGLGVNPEDTMLMNNIGMCQLIRMEYEAALEMFAKAAAIVPGNTKYRANMAVALSLLGRYEESASLFRHILSQEDTDHNVNTIRDTKWNPLTADG